MKRSALWLVGSLLVTPAVWAEPGAVESPAGEERALTVRERLRMILDTVSIDDVAARDAFDWYSKTTGIPLVINWDAMAEENVDPEAPLTIELRNVPAGQLLGIMLRQWSPEQELIFEASPYYMQIMTKAQANKFRVVRVYVVDDLLMEIPAFEDAPQVSLNDALSNTSSGGGGNASNGAGGGGGGAGMFGEIDEDTEPRKTKTERGGDLAGLIRDTIEPDVWVENGGDSTVKYFQGKLIVSAPMYVHRQIGIPVSSSAATAKPAAYPRSGNAAAPGQRPSIVERGNGVSGISD